MSRRGPCLSHRHMPTKQYAITFPRTAVFLYIDAGDLQASQGDTNSQRVVCNSKKGRKKLPQNRREKGAAITILMMPTRSYKNHHFSLK